MKSLLNLILLTAVFLCSILNTAYAKKKSIEFQSGTISLRNGTTLQGIVALKKSHGEDEVWYKKNTDAVNTHHYSISEVISFNVGKQPYEVKTITLENGKTTTALLEPITKGAIKLYRAFYYTEQPLGKNNSATKRVESHLIAHYGELVELSGNDYKKKLTELWIDEQAYLEKLQSLEKVGIEELQQIVVD